MAVEHFQRALRLSPVDPLTFNIYIGIGLAHFEQQDYERAATWLEKGVEEKPDAVWALRVLSAASFHAGRVDRATEAMTAFRRSFPSLNITTILELTPGSDWAKRQFTVAFRALGLPE